jgi:hypothetical protein
MAAKVSARLESVMDDEHAPIKVRVEAAKTILDRAGIVAPSVFERAADFERRRPGGSRWRSCRWRNWPPRQPDMTGSWRGWA